MNSSWAPLIALAATLLPLLWVKQWITRHVQELSLRWVGYSDVALVVYFTLVLPGIVVHELSHWLMASLLGVRVRKLSLGPVRKGRSRQVSLGSVQVGNVDPVRASLIGLAPLLGGTAVILLVGTLVLGLGNIAEAMVIWGLEGMLAGLQQMARVPDLWLWFYLIFAVSNAMLPSQSDMAAIRPVLIFLGIIAVFVLVVSGVPAIPEEVVRGVNAVAGYLATAFAVTLVVDCLFVAAIWLLLWITRSIQDR